MYDKKKQMILLPNLPKESIIVMDNSTFHKGKDMQKMLEDAGHSLLYLPPLFSGSQSY